MFFEQPRRSEIMGGPVGRGQYSIEDAELYVRAAAEFPNVEVRQVASAGEECHAYGGWFKVGEGNVALEITGHSDEDPGNLLGSFHTKVEKLIAEQQENQGQIT